MPMHVQAQAQVFLMVSSKKKSVSDGCYRARLLAMLYAMHD